MKACKKCKISREADGFYKVKGNLDGLSGKCKECTKADVRANYKKNIKYYKDYEKKRASMPHRVAARKAYQATKAGKLAMLKANNNYRKKYPNKYKARNVVNNAIRDGKLFKGSCEVCSSFQNIHAHHDDYLKPLNVRWLCSAHHSQWHRDNGEALNP